MLSPQAVISLVGSRVISPEREIVATNKRQKMLRASEQQQERWEQAADEQGESFNSWACDALDAAADFAGPDPAPGYLPAEKEREIARLTALLAKYEAGAQVVSVRDLLPGKEASKSGCPFDTPRGTKCKACGKAH